MSEKDIFHLKQKTKLYFNVKRRTSPLKTVAIEKWYEIQPLIRKSSKLIKLLVKLYTFLFSKIF